MKKITLIQKYEINIPNKLQNATPVELLNHLNAMYYIHGKNIINILDDSNEYVNTTLVEIDDESVYINDNVIQNKGSDIILNGEII